MEHSENTPILVARAGPLQGQRWPLTKPMLVGRDAGCDIIIPDRQVSRLHARFLPVSEGIFLEDVGSKNGTYRNGSMLKEPVLLQDGDVIQIALAQEFLYLAMDATTPLPEAGSEGGRLTIDERARRVWVNRILLEPPLSVLQFRALHFLYQHSGEVVSRNDLIVAVWGRAEAAGVSDQALDALLRRLRERLAEVDPLHVYLVTVRGHGIRLENPR
ncbi:MAG: FHA domain-containing protein [Anaerolineales bacterium]|nr:FHA domain-containing protein [Anaerolineales bacterium]MCX7609410.1 FHA domain-containing protein [Anaerolineales bacterium]MDW8227121.1 FHA domain-containing protein [Anaerolineales bacterium]